MLRINLAMMLVALALPVVDQKPAPVPGKSTAPVASNAAVPAADPELHESAKRFLEASDIRQRLQQNLDKSLEDGKQAMLRPGSGFDPQFADEWIKRMHRRINLDDMVDATARIYEKYFTRDEFAELTHSQLGLKRGQMYTLAPELAEKLKTKSPLIQREINAQTLLLGSRLNAAVGQEIQNEHPNWVKLQKQADPSAKP